MIEAYGNIWDHIDDYDAVVITTNGSIKKNGDAVLGRGIALEAKNRFKWLPKNLGNNLRYFGNRVYVYDIEPNFTRDSAYDFSLYTLPVKHEWMQKADIGLIEESIKNLVRAIDQYKYKENYKVIMPRPGCGNGGLKWKNVKPVIEPYLDDRFTVMEKTFRHEEHYNLV